MGIIGWPIHKKTIHKKKLNILLEKLNEKKLT